MVLRWICVFIVLFAAPAYALDFTEFGAIGFSFPHLQSNNDSSLGASPGFGWGGGATVGVRVWNSVYFEPGLIFISRSFSQHSDTLSRTGYGFLTFQVPLIVRYWFSESYSVGVGGYWAQGIGNVAVSQGSSFQVRGFNDLSWAVNDAGVVVSFRYRKSLNEVIQFVLDGRLLIGTSNVDTSGTQSFQFRDLQSLVGISYNL